MCDKASAIRGEKLKSGGNINEKITGARSIKSGSQENHKRRIYTAACLYMADKIH